MLPQQGTRPWHERLTSCNSSCFRCLERWRKSSKTSMLDSASSCSSLRFLSPSRASKESNSFIGKSAPCREHRSNLGHSKITATMWWSLQNTISGATKGTICWLTLVQWSNPPVVVQCANVPQEWTVRATEMMSPSSSTADNMQPTYHQNPPLHSFNALYLIN